MPSFVEVSGWIGLYGVLWKEVGGDDEWWVGRVS